MALLTDREAAAYCGVGKSTWRRALRPELQEEYGLLVIVIARDSKGRLRRRIDEASLDKALRRRSAVLLREA